MLQRNSDYVITKSIYKVTLRGEYEATKFSNGEFYGMIKIPKTIPKSNTPLEGKYILCEVFLLKRRGNHPNILKLYDYWESQNSRYLVVEYWDGGNLVNEIKSGSIVKNNGDSDGQVKFRTSSGLGEKKSIFFLMQILSGLKTLQGERVALRDLKPSDLLLRKDGRLLLGNFGFVRLEYDLTRVNPDCNRGYKAPEAPLRPGEISSFHNKVHLWLAGVNFFEMIFGRELYSFPSSEGYEEDDELKKKIKRNSGQNLEIPEAQKISSECLDLLRRLLEYDIDERISWNEVFNHPLFGKYSDQELHLATGYGLEMIGEVRRVFYENKDCRPGDEKLRSILMYVEQSEGLRDPQITSL